jgi:uncharacterized protein (TIGR02145 family)
MKNLFYLLFWSSMLSWQLTSCKKVSLATVTTTAPHSITNITAISGGNVINEGGSGISQRGICWGLTANPTIVGKYTIDGSGLGGYTSTLTSLSANTNYYVRAYAINTAGIAYGNQVTFTTTGGASVIVSNPGAGVTVNGYTYPTIVLGNGQEWMTENLRTTTYNNGDPILNVTDVTQWSNINGSGAWVYYNNDSQYDNPYGKLYNWYAVKDNRKLCPTGWHVPTDADWDVLSDYLGGEAVAGGRMKTTGFQYWLSPNTSATNESGFSGLPGGYRSADAFNKFYDIGSIGIWWSSTDEEDGVVGDPFDRILRKGNAVALRGRADRRGGNSVRCIKN